MEPWHVFPTSPRDHDNSLAVWVVYQAGGACLQDRGDLLISETTGFSDLTDSVQKAACTQAVCGRVSYISAYKYQINPSYSGSSRQSQDFCSKLLGWNMGGSCPKHHSF